MFKQYFLLEKRGICLIKKCVKKTILCKLAVLRITQNKLNIVHKILETKEFYFQEATINEQMSLQQTVQF